MHFPGLPRQVRQELGGTLGQTLIKAFLGVSGILALDVCLSIAVAIVLARSLGVAGLGVYGFGVAVGRLLTPLLHIGLPGLLAREISHGHARGELQAIRGLAMFAATLSLGLSAAFAIVAYIGWPYVVPWLPAAYGPAVFAGLFLTPTVALASVCHGGLQGWRRVNLAAASVTALPNGSMLILLLAALALLPGWLTPGRAIGLNVAAHAVALGLAGVYLVMHTQRRVGAASPVYKVAAWRRSMFRFTAINGLAVAEQQALTFILGALASETQIGLFRIAQRAAALANLGGMTIVRVVSPYIGQSYARGAKTRLQKLVTRAAQGMAVSSLLVALVFAGLGGKLLDLAVGAEYRPAHAPLVILALGTFVRAVFGPIEALMNMTGHENTVVRARVVAITLTLGVAVALMGENAAFGASIATALGLMVVAVMLWRDARRLLDCRTSALGF